MCRTGGGLMLALAGCYCCAAGKHGGAGASHRALPEKVVGLCFRFPLAPGATGLSVAALRMCVPATTSSTLMPYMVGKSVSKRVALTSCPPPYLSAVPAHAAVSRLTPPDPPDPPAPPTPPIPALLHAKVRAEQALLTELESEWLNQFWVQGRRHAVLHPWWRGPMALVLATWRELERRTALTVQRLMSLRDDEGLGLGGARASASAASASAVAEPAAIARAFETVLRVLEERRESRSRWSSRFADPAYRSLPADCSPVVPALWPADGGGRGSGGVDGAGSPLPQSLAGVISRLRECYTAVYRTASGGKKAGSAKAIAAGAASNWELFRAGSSSPSAPSGAKLNGGGGGRAGGEDGKKSGGARGGRTAGRGPKRKRPNKKQERGSK